MPRPHSARGLTLIELLVSTAILSLVLVAATGALLAQNRAYLRSSGVREAREQGTAALDVLEKAVRMAGYGIDPQLAFDFDYYNCSLAGVAGSITQSTPCTTLRRDSATQADELVVYFRDPSYDVNATSGGCANSSNLVGNVWRVASVNTGTPSLTLTMRGGDIIRKGQVLQVICQDAATYTYVTVAAAPTTPSACTDVTLTLAGTQSVAGPTGSILSPYSRPDLLTNNCFGSGYARAYKVDRQHFFIHQDTTSTTQPRPFLMLDQGLDIAGPGGGGPDGVLDDNDLVPVASDVEDLQISYGLDQVDIAQTGVMTGVTSTYMLDSNQNGVWGDTPGVSEQLTANAAATSPYLLSSAFAAANTKIGAGSSGVTCYNSLQPPYNYPCLFDKTTLEVTGTSVHPYRWTPWTGNITQVRIGLSVRSALGSARSTGLTSASSDVRYLVPLENRAQVDLQGSPGWYGANAVNYQHSYFSGAVRTVNMMINGLFLF